MSAPARVKVATDTALPVLVQTAGIVHAIPDDGSELGQRVTALCGRPVYVRAFQLRREGEFCRACQACQAKSAGAR